MRRRRRRRAAELTSLLDVLFILLFASLIHARHTAERSTRPAEPAPDAGGLLDAGLVDAGLVDAGLVDASPAADAGVADALPAADAGSGHQARARARRIATLVAGAVRSRDVHVIEVSVAGYVVERGRWRDGAVLQRERLHYQLLRKVPPEESDVELAYRGDTQPAHRICHIALANADPAAPDGAPDGGASDPTRALVVITIGAPLAELPRALRDGLLRDAGRCFDDAGGIAILIDPRRDLYEIE